MSLPERPTDSAHRYFRSASRTADLAIPLAPSGVGKSGLYHVFSSLSDIAKGLDNMATGIRATYLKLEQIEERIKSLETKVK